MAHNFLKEECSSLKVVQMQVILECEKNLQAVNSSHDKLNVELSICNAGKSHLCENVSLLLADNHKLRHERMVEQLQISLSKKARDSSVEKVLDYYFVFTLCMEIV